MSPGYPGDPVGPLTQLCHEVLLRGNQHQAVPPVVAEIPQCNEGMGLELGLEPSRVEVSLKQREQLSHRGSGGLVCLPAARAQAEPLYGGSSSATVLSEVAPKGKCIQNDRSHPVLYPSVYIPECLFPMNQATCSLYFRVHILQVTRPHSY